MISRNLKRRIGGNPRRDFPEDELYSTAMVPDHALRKNYYIQLQSFPAHKDFRCLLAASMVPLALQVD